SRDAARELEETIAQTDAQDPAWRLEELASKRKSIPDQQNSALRVLAAAKLLPGKWSHKLYHDELDEINPPDLLNDQLAASLHKDLGKVKPAIRQARALKSLPGGRYRVHWPDDFFSAKLPHLEQVRQVVRLLAWDAILQAHDKDLKQAW